MKYSREKLMLLRNKINIKRLIAYKLNLPNKMSEGYFRFLCPVCSEFNTATNPKTNLARCFRCKRNFNPIDMVMVVDGCDFLTAVDYLEQFLR